MTTRTAPSPSVRTVRHHGLARFTAVVLRRRRTVGLLWFLVGLVGLALIGTITGRLTSSENLPGLPSFDAGRTITHLYGTGGTTSPAVLIVTVPPGERVEGGPGRQLVARALAPLGADRSLRVVSFTGTGDRRLVSSDGRSTVAFVFTRSGRPTSAQLAAALRARAPAGVHLAATGLGDLYATRGSGGVGILGETLLGGVGALAVMMLIFGSLLALVPLAVATVSILATFLALGAITAVTPVSQLVEYLVSLIGLGIAIDYSLLVVTRWREERRRGLANDDAVVVAMATAGRSLAYSGVTVAIGLFAIVVLPIPFLRSLGYGGLLIPLVTVTAALTLLPVLLASFGPRLDRRSRRDAATGRVRTPSGWMRWTRAVLRHRAAAGAAALVVVAVLLGAAFQLRAGEATPASVARTGPAEAGLVALQRDGFPLGLLQPIEILVPARDHPAALAGDLGHVPGVDTVVAPIGPSWRRAGTALLDVLPVHVTSTAADEATVSAVRAEVERLAPGAVVAGDGALEADFVHALYGRFPLIVALVSLVSLLALARALRSAVLPLKALLLNVLSLGAAYGALVLLWQKGFGSRALWGIPATGVVIDFVPLVLFAFLFGLSMDYEVFILTRIKEAHDAGMATDDAIVEGLGRTGALVTSAAAILVLAFAALASGPQVSVKVFATAMAVGIAFDATVIRGLLLPALLSAIGERAWWWPVAGRRTMTARRGLAPLTPLGAAVPVSPTVAVRRRPG